MKKVLTLLSVCAAFTLASCNDATHDAHEGHHMTEQRVETPAPAAVTPADTTVVVTPDAGATIVTPEGGVTVNPQ